MQKQLSSEFNWQIKLVFKMSCAHELPTIWARASVSCAAFQHHFQSRSENHPSGPWKPPFSASMAVLCGATGSGACPHPQPLSGRASHVYPAPLWKLEAAPVFPHLPLCWWLVKWGGTSSAVRLPLTSRIVPSQWLHIKIAFQGNNLSHFISPSSGLRRLKSKVLKFSLSLFFLLSLCHQQFCASF